MTGTNGVSSAEGRLQWQVGLLNHQGKYLTAETFGFKINASSPTMRKKQQWVIEHDDREDNVIYIRSHLGRYLIGEKKGAVRCDSEEKTEETKFKIEYKKDGTWTFQNVSNGYFFGGAEDGLRCYEKVAGPCETWTARLHVHPHVNMLSVNRRRYAHLAEGTNQIQFEETIPWGVDALITLQFVEGKYAIKSCKNQFLHRDGSMQDTCSGDTLFTLELHSAKADARGAGLSEGMALKDSQGKYLTAVGSTAVMKGLKDKVTKDHLFRLEDSHAQVIIRAHNNKLVSTKQGVDVSANQDEVSDKEMFQVEFDKKAEQWRIRTCDNKYWSLEHAQGIQAVGNDRSGTGLFSMEHQSDGAVALKASNGRYVTARMNGALYATSDSYGDKERFWFTIVNRPALILRGEHGFVGLKSAASTRIECNKTTPDPIGLEHTNATDGCYYLKGSNGKYWRVDEQKNVNADSSEPEAFFLEMTSQSRLTLKSKDGVTLDGEQSGLFQAKGIKGTQWEY